MLPFSMQREEIWNPEFYNPTTQETKSPNYFNGSYGFHCVIESWIDESHLSKDNYAKKKDIFAFAVSDLFNSDLMIDNYSKKDAPQEIKLIDFFKQNEEFRNVLILYYVATVAQDKELYKNITYNDGVQFEDGDTINSLQLKKKITQ
jgi:hypothetical protein